MSHKCAAKYSWFVRRSTAWFQHYKHKNTLNIGRLPTVLKNHSNWPGQSRIRIQFYCFSAACAPSLAATQAARIVSLKMHTKTSGHNTGTKHAHQHGTVHNSLSAICSSVAMQLLCIINSTSSGRTCCERPRESQLAVPHASRACMHVIVEQLLRQRHRMVPAERNVARGALARRTET